MDSKVFNQEKEKLKQVCKALEKETESAEDRILSAEKMYSKDDFIRAHLKYLSEKKLKDIKNIKNKPYFARVDFKETKGKLNEVYIGKISVIDSETNSPIVIDWRAPISNLYYDGRIGKASYICPVGEIEGDILLKRQYIIENQKLEKYIDIDLKTNDELLQNAISEKADERLKNIVATIQDEQNKIIRADIRKPLIVQGVAGSGKTTIALHRIAYLIYNYEKDFNPDTFMIIAPNKFFLNYISNVLPDLGVENVKQYTFEDFAYEIIGKRLKISDSNEKLVTIVNKEFDSINNGNINIMIQESKFKSSLNFKKIVDKYIEKIEYDYLPKKDFIVGGMLIMKNEEMQKLFLETYQNHNLNRRLEEVKKHIKSNLDKKSDLIIAGIREKRSLVIKQLECSGKTDEYIRNKRIEVFDKYEEMIKLFENDYKKLFSKFFETIPKFDCLEYYKDFIKNFVGQYIEDDILKEYLIKNTGQILDKKEVTFEDLAPIIYLQYKIYGAKFNTVLNHVIIDEAQDYGEFQFSVLKTILNSNSMTILGDIAQGVHFYRGIENWNKFIEKEFPEGGATYTTLDKTYRTTREIMEKANEVIKKLPEEEKENIIIGVPVINGTNSIHVYKKESDNEIIQSILEKIEEYKKQGFKSIAIIGKDIDECKMIKTKINKFNKDVKLIQSKDSEYNAGISIVPSYLAKGLEFDSVILYNVSEEKYTNSILDIKLLYVAITRAMSKLDVFYKGNLSKIF